MGSWPIIAGGRWKNFNNSASANAIHAEVVMARIAGVEPHEASWLTRIIYWFVRRKMAKIVGQKRVVEPVKVTAHHSRLLKALGQMEMGQDAARSVSATLKGLASLRAATLIGCPF
jgi:hypothetical protein